MKIEKISESGGAVSLDFVLEELRILSVGKS